MGYVLKDGDVEIDAKQINPASSSAEQLAAWCGGTVNNGGSRDASLTLPGGLTAYRDEWVVRMPDGTLVIHSDEQMRGLAYLPAPTPAQIAAKEAEAKEEVARLEAAAKALKLKEEEEARAEARAEERAKAVEAYAQAHPTTAPGMTPTPTPAPAPDPNAPYPTQA